jgi:hypothetical protein
MWNFAQRPYYKGVLFLHARIKQGHIVLLTCKVYYLVVATYILYRVGRYVVESVDRNHF